jgi:hypothetical protein
MNFSRKYFLHTKIIIDKSLGGGQSHAGKDPCKHISWGRADAESQSRDVIVKVRFPF